MSINCPKCNSNLPKDAITCFSCGTEQPRRSLGYRYHPSFGAPWFWFLLSWCCFLVVPAILFILLIAQKIYSEQALWSEWVLRLCFLASIAAGGWSRWTAKRILTPDVRTVLARDSRPPILYLRSDRVDERHPVSLSLMPWLIGGPSGPGVSFERHLVSVLEKLGPVIAVGQRNEYLPRLGAARMYADQDQWQSLVTFYLERCQLVVLRAGTTPGVLWEAHQIRAIVPPSKLLLFLDSPRVARRSDAEFENRRAAVCNALGVVLPVQNDVRFFRFGPNWEAIPLNPRRDPSFRLVNQRSELRHELLPLLNN
jgi:hypothetical protein